MPIHHGDYARNVMCDAVVDLIDVGADVGKLRIIDGTNGTIYVSGNDGIGPADNATPVDGAGTWSEYIAELRFAAEAFRDAGLPNSDVPEEVTVGGRSGTAHANPVEEDDNCNLGTATEFEIVDGDGRLVLRGWVRDQNDPDGDILLTSTGIAAGDTIAIRNLSYTCAP